MDILLNLLKDKKQLLSFLIKTMEESGRESEGLIKLAESLTREDPNLKPENMAKCLATSMKIISKQAVAIQTLASVALIQTQSSSFDTDVAQMLGKMGKGEEALKQMFQNKFGHLKKPTQH